MPVLKIKRNGNWVEVWGSTSVGGSASLRSSVTLYKDAWVGSEAPYTQVVTINGVSAISAVDFSPTPEQVIEFGKLRLAFQAVNNGGEVVVSALASKPLKDYTMDVKITDSINV